MQSSKKSQAAMEFLLTYGWAILIVLVVIGALSYFGVLNPARLLPDKCYFGSFGKCIDFAVIKNGDNGIIWIYLINNLGKPIDYADVKFSGDAGSCTNQLVAITKNIDVKRVMGGDIVYIGQAMADGNIKMLDSSTSAENLCPACPGWPGDTNPADCCSANWLPGEKASVVVAGCNNVLKGQRIKEQIEITYSFAGSPGFTHISSGEVAGIATTYSAQ